MCCHKLKLSALCIVLLLAAQPLHAGWLFGDNKNPLDHAIAAYNSAEYMPAAQELQELINKGLSSNNKELAYWYMSKAYRKAGKPDRALPTLQLAVELYPESVRLQLSLAELYLDSGLYPQAKTLYDAMNALQSVGDEYLLPINAGRARTYEALGYLTRAAEYYKKALDMEQQFDALVSMEYIRCLLKQRKYIDATTAVETALAQAPENVELLFLSAKISYEAGRKEKAATTLQYALEKAPERNDIRLTRALWLCSMGRYQQAAQEAEKVYAAEPDQTQAQWTLGLALSGIPGSEHRAIALFREASNSITSPFTAKAAGLMLERLSKRQASAKRQVP